MKTKQIRSMMTEIKGESDDNQKVIRGYFAVFDDETNLYDKVFEKLDRSAFNNSINSDVRALINHDTSLVLGRTTSNTLKLRTDNKGLYGEIYINEKDTDAMNIYERVKRGDVSQCSFGFTVNDEDVEYRDDDTVHFTIKDLDLYEVSVCTFPAYSNTGVEAREKQVQEHKKRELQIKKDKLKERLTNA